MFVDAEKTIAATAPGIGKRLVIKKRGEMVVTLAILRRNFLLVKLVSKKTARSFSVSCLGFLKHSNHRYRALK